MGIERAFRRMTIVLLALGVAIASGAGIARWTIATSDGFYLDPRQRAPAHAGRSPTAATFWDRQDGR